MVVVITAGINAVDGSDDHLQRVSVGPEIYRVKRTRLGGACQAGVLYGGRAIYERIPSSGLYWSAEGLIAQGILKGKMHSGDKVRSTFTDKGLEGRLGYTFCKQIYYKALWTPFVGYGYFREDNRYHSSSPLKVNLKNCYRYFPFGLLTTVAMRPDTTAGVNVIWKAMWRARCHVTGDRHHDNVTMSIADEVNFRIEFPLRYRCEGSGTISRLEWALIPFYERRHYGGKENFPFDFLDTKVKAYGANAALSYYF